MLCKSLDPAPRDSRPVATVFTLRFVEELLPKSAKILEVGCGLGHLAALLTDLGHDILAIDTSESAVQTAKRRRIRAEQTSIEGVEEKNFDSVLFTRSLHHIHPIGSCLDKTKEILRPGGSIIIEDFGYDLMDDSTAIWYQGLRNSLAPIIKQEDWVAPQGEALKHWMEHHSSEHQLHKATDLEQEVGKRFSNVRVVRNLPYLFRYFIGKDELPRETVDAIFQWEQKLISDGSIKGIGLRIVGSNP